MNSKKYILFMIVFTTFFWICLAYIHEYNSGVSGFATNQADNAKSSINSIIQSDRNTALVTGLGIILLIGALILFLYEDHRD